MEDNCNPRIIELLSERSSVKQEVFRNSIEHFNLLKETVKNIAKDLSDRICNVDKSVVVDYKDKSKFECEIHFGGDILLFNMQTNVFTMDKGHGIWQSSYIKQDTTRAYFAMINIYNFLTDSFRYNRTEDYGVLLGRVFVNREGHFFVEGKRQLGFIFTSLANQKLNAENMKKLVDTAVIQGIEYDLTVPDYREVMLVSVREIMATSNELHLKASKKVEIGYYNRMKAEKEKN